LHLLAIALGARPRLLGRADERPVVVPERYARLLDAGLIAVIAHVIERAPCAIGALPPDRGIAHRVNEAQELVFGHANALEEHIHVGRSDMIVVQHQIDGALTAHATVTYLV